LVVVIVLRAIVLRSVIVLRAIEASVFVKAWSSLSFDLLCSPPFFSKQLLQKTGLEPFGLKGTSHSLPQLLQVVLNISLGLRSKLRPPPLLSLLNGLLKLPIV
jgi:hypothetical protein